MVEDHDPIEVSPLHSPPSQMQIEEKPTFRRAQPTTDTIVEEMKVGPEIVHLQEQQKRPSFAWRQQLQEKLFHRHEEEATVLHCYENMLNGEPCSLLLVTGPIGAGKTRLAQHTLRSRVQQQGGYFITGKFDQLRRPEPYRAFVSAFSEFTSQVVERGPNHVEHMRSAILDAVGDESFVLTSMIPALEQLLGNAHKNDSKANVDDAIQRFVFVFRMFMRAVSSLQQPVVLLLDDLHWADPCSLDVLGSIVTDLKHNPGLFLIGTCDDIDVISSEHSYLSRKLRDVEKGAEAPITQVSVHNLDVGEVNHLLGNALQLPRLEQSEDLGKIVSSQTNGNLFYIIEFVRYLEESGLLSFDSSSGSWFWDAEEIRMTIDIKHVGGFLVDKLEQLPMKMRDALKVAACMGSHLEEELIEFVLDYPVGDMLAEAAEKGILARQGSRGKYAFEHDGLQAAAYNLIPESERELFHLEIGRRLWRRLSKDALDGNIFVLLSQISIGRRLITREKERYAIANLCLHAGKKAAKSSTFRTASVYLNLGIELLGERSWRDDYDLTLALYNAAAEMELCVANLDAMEILIDTVLEKARLPGDKIQAYATRLYAMGSMRDRPQDAIDLGVEILTHLKEGFPRMLCKYLVKREMKHVRRLLRGMSNEKIIRLPNMVDGDKLACMQILNIIFLNTLVNRPKLAPFISLKMIELTLTYGLSMMAPAAFSTYGMFCISAMNDIDGGFRFGELALELLERFGAKQYLPRVYAAYYGCIHFWKNPVRETLEPMLHAHRVGMQTGDMEFGCLNANLYCFVALDAGIPLATIEAEWTSFQDTMISNRQQALLRMSQPCVQAIHHYMGFTDDPLAAKGDLIDSDEVLRYAIEHKLFSSALGIRVTRMVLAYVFNDFELADKLSKICVNDIWAMPPSFELFVSGFMMGMIALAMAGQGTSVRKNVRYGKKMIRWGRKYARICPANFLDKRFLLEAELAFVEGKDDARAFEKYTCAIALAKQNKFKFNEALANERTARFFVARDRTPNAEPYFRAACSLYEEWGARAKVERLQEEINSLYE